MRSNRVVSVPNHGPDTTLEERGLVIAMPQVSAGSWQAAGRYGESRKPNLTAVGASVAVVAGLMATIISMNVVSFQKQPHQRIVVANLESPPPPPPPQQDVKPVPVVPPPASPIVAPPPPIVLADNPPPVATSPVPVPAPAVSAVASAPVTSTNAAPAAPAPAPRVENAGDLSSKMISATPPRYPLDSRRKREQGTVVLAVMLGLDGTVSDISISKSSGFERLDHAALSAVRRWRWSPTRRDGAPVMVRGLVEIPFVLQT
ncbi:energy transducer TonB [Novosphingobium clariflavum]|uniref:Energy transducer TonB n=2 Tax=Novosphingobium TaxID=165696 RepID=A0ABV6SBN5_9SPHN|nr:energy transducer TonB [Novosphingobium clariflavum]